MIKYKHLAKFRVPKRFVIVAMVFFGYGNIFYLHTNLAMAVVEMTSSKNYSDTNGNVVHIEPEFKWNSKEKGLVLSTFSYGRLLGPVGGVLAGRIGGATLFGIAIMVTALVTLMTPYLLYNSFSLFVITNVILGVFEAFQYASISQLWSRWAPPDERSKFVSFSVIGLYVGNIIAFLIAGWMLNTWAWPWLFYVSGAATLGWYGIWVLVVSNDPH
ncbi:vesicular glutamate transporter 3-like [Planococcus citri]|uniref:vesicular glutamate transporter 3-like n=1 Tax=Planococcus citri TaxID=170843 RepID=UPI0031F8046D